MRRYLSNPVAICLFALPALLLYSVVVFYPILQIFYRSLFEWDGASDPTFIGFDNFIALKDDPILYTSLKNGLIFAAVLVVFQIGLGSILALLLSDPTVKGRRLLKTAYFVPVVLSVTVVCQLWLAMYDPQNGLINKLFSVLGLSYRQNWLTSTNVSIVAIALVNAWQFMGYQFSLLYAGLKSIPEQYYEAARIDGASKWRAHLSVTIPLLAETYKFCFIVAITSGIGAFAQMLIMTNGGPGTTTYTLTMLVFRSAFKTNEYGYGCAVSVVLVLLCLLATLIIDKLFARERVSY
jgi:raffinose/stachyose/melibiose transport system permease protein